MTARFQLLIHADGRAVLATTEKLTDQQIKTLQGLFADWTTAQPAEALIVGECDVIRVTDVQLALDPAEAR